MESLSRKEENIIKDIRNHFRLTKSYTAIKDLFRQKKN